MKRGHELEPEARRHHQIAHGEVVYPAGFVVSDDGHFGCSADGLIGEDGGVEYKSLIGPESLMDVYTRDDWSEYLDQVHGCMWVTGRSWWHLCCYCPEIVAKPFKMIKVERDEAYIRELQSDLLEFRGLVDEYEAAMRL